MWSSRAMLCLITAQLLLGAFAPVTATCEDDIPSTLVKLSKHAKYRLRLIEVYGSRAGFDGADVISSYTIIRPSLRVPFAKWGEIDMQLRYDVRNYEFDGTSDLVSESDSTGTPFDALQHYSVRLGTNLQLFENAFFSGGGFVRAKWERGADFGDAQRVGGFAGFGYQFTPRFFAALGVGFQKKAKGGSLNVVPIWRAHWQILERLDILLNGRTGRVRLDLNDKFQLQVIGRYAERSYRLDRRGEDSATRLVDRSIPVFARLVWKKNKYLRVEFDAGVFVNQYLETNAGDSKQRIDQGSPVYIGLGFRFRN